MASSSVDDDVTIILRAIIPLVMEQARWTDMAAGGTRFRARSTRAW